MNAPSLGVLRLDPELTIYNAAAVRTQLLAALAVHPRLTLDLGDVCEFDSSGLQLLVAAARQAKARGAELAFTGHGPAVCDAFNLLGLDPADPLAGEEHHDA